MESTRPPRPSLAEYWILPGLLIAMVLSQQEEWTFASVRIGYFFSALTLLSAFSIFLKSCRTRFWPTLYIVLLFVSAIVSLMTQEKISYRLLTGFLYCVCGAYLMTFRTTLIYRQVMYFLLLNVCLMIPQILGVEWFQFLTTHGGIYSVPTLFVSESDLFYNVIQGRPAGLCYSNIILSLISLFGISLHFPRSHGRILWATFTMSMLVIVAMAKVIFAGYFLICIYLLITGDPTQKRGVLFSLVTVSLLLWAYSIIFPGLFAVNLSGEIIAISVFGRIADILSLLSNDNALSVAVENYLRYQPQVEIRPDVPLSGIATALPFLPYILVAAIMITPLFLKRIRQIRGQNPGVAETVIPTLIIVLLYPVVFPVWHVPLYWFTVGFALLPILHRKHWALQSSYATHHAPRELTWRLKESPI